MFPLLAPPLLLRAARALDLALEFATLGEYWLDVRAPGPVGRQGVRGSRPRRSRGERTDPLPELVGPATVAGRRRIGLEREAPAPHGAPAGAPAAGAATPEVGRVAARAAGMVAGRRRSRGGSVQPPVQPCISRAARKGPSDPCR